MVQPSRPRHRRRSVRALAALALAVLVLVPAAAPAQEVLREDLAPSAVAQTIQLSADEIVTWADGGSRIFLLRGNACVTQGGVTVRTAQGVVCLDEAGYARTNVYALDLYGEGGFELQGARSRSAPLGVVHLATRGEVRIKSYARPVQQTAQPADPVYRRARALLPAPAAVVPAGGGAPPAPIQQAVALLPAQAAAPIPPAPMAVPAAPVPPPDTNPPPPPPPVTLGPIEGARPGAPATAPAPPPGPPVAPAQGPPRRLTIRPRSPGVSPGLNNYKLEGETAYVYTGGIILTVTNPGDKKGVLDIEGDRLVVWMKDDPDKSNERLRSPQGETTRQMEFYLSGHVELRYQGTKGETETLTADEVYYDVGRSVAIALQGDLEIRQPKLPYPLHFKAPEIRRLNSKVFETGPSEVFSTILPSDPGLKIELRKTRLEEKEIVRTSIFGQPFIDPKTGQSQVETQRYFTGRDMVVRLEGVPIFYFPYFAGDVNDPLGPLDALSFNYNRIFGFQVYSTWDIYDLLGVRRPIGTRWRLYVDYLSARGPALGTQFDYNGTNLFGLTGKFESTTKLWGIQDQGHDIIGTGGDAAYVSPTSAVPIVHPEYRGRAFERFNAQQLPDGFSVQSQLSLISDRNFMEQYYFSEYMNDLNQESFVYLKQQKDNWAWTALVEPRWRDWVTETQWFPKLDGYLLGQTLFDRLIYSAHVGAGYAELRPTNQPPPPYQPTDVDINTGRFHLWQEVSLPFTLGPVTLLPYAKADVAYYTEDINANNVGRLWGGGGLRANVPFSKLYPDICSDLFNVDGIYHKIQLSGNYFNAGATTGYKNLPQLDRLNDDATDFTLRNMHVLEPSVNPNGLAVVANPLFFNPQDYAIRKLVDNYIDTLDAVQVLQFDLRQRWQTKRGFPGSEHVVDWMTLDVQATLFPDSHRDDYGHLFGFLEYDWNWNIGDRTALSSSGWFEPFQGGAKVFNLGMSFNRPDTTNFYLGYRQIDPLDSRAVIASVTYPFSAKYALTASTTWDFGVHYQVYSLLLSRIGTDVMFNVGISYNSILGNFGFTFEIIPNLLRGSIRPGSGLSTLGSSYMGSSGSGR